jgi:hypothetical protein
MLGEALEWCESMELLSLSEVCNSTKDKVVFVLIMAINISQSEPISESTVDGILSSSTSFISLLNSLGKSGEIHEGQLGLLFTHIRLDSLSLQSSLFDPSQ